MYFYILCMNILVAKITRLPTFFVDADGYFVCDEGNLTLTNGNGMNEGRVEICVNNSWWTVCDSDWGTEEATIVCKQLGFIELGTDRQFQCHNGMFIVYIELISYIHVVSDSGKQHKFIAEVY